MRKVYMRVYIFIYTHNRDKPMRFSCQYNIYKLKFDIVVK